MLIIITLNVSKIQSSQSKHSNTYEPTNAFTNRNSRSNIYIFNEIIINIRRQTDKMIQNSLLLAYSYARYTYECIYIYILVRLGMIYTRYIYIYV